MKREPSREKVIRAVGLIIQCEYGRPGPISGQIAHDASEAFRQHVEDLFEAACREFVAVLNGRDQQPA